MYPQPVPIVATDPNLTGMPIAPMGPVMIPPYAGPMINSPQNFLYIQDPFTEIAQSRTAVIRQETALLESVITLQSEGKTQRAIAAELGISTSKVNRLLKKHYGNGIRPESR